MNSLKREEDLDPDEMKKLDDELARFWETIILISIVGVSMLFTGFRLFALPENSATYNPEITLFKRRYLCSSGLIPRTFSSSRDAVIMSVIDRDNWYEHLLFSIRTCGCKARIIILTEQEHLFNKFYLMALEYTETEVVRQPKPNDHRGSTDFIRNCWLLWYLKRAEHEFDRILVVDSYDVYFQRDPFEVMNATDRLVFIGEGLTVNQDAVDKRWMEACYGNEGVQITGDKMVLCSGTIYGPPRLFIGYLELLLEKPWRPGCIWDQPVMIYQVYSGRLDKHGIKHEIKDCYGPILTLNLCPKGTKVINGVTEAVNGNDVIPHVVHQWNKYWHPVYLKLYQDRCEVGNFRKLIEQYGEPSQPGLI